MPAAERLCDQFCGPTTEVPIVWQDLLHPKDIITQLLEDNIIMQYNMHHDLCI